MTLKYSKSEKHYICDSCKNWQGQFTLIKFETISGIKRLMSKCNWCDELTDIKEYFGLVEIEELDNDDY